MGFYSSLLRVVFAVTMIGKTACLISFSPINSVRPSPTWMRYNAFTSPLDMNTVTTRLRNLVPWSSFIQPHMATKAPTSPSIMTPIASSSTRRTSVLQQIPPTITSNIGEVIYTSSVLLPTIDTSVPSDHDHITPSPTTRSVQATTSIVLVSKG